MTEDPLETVRALERQITERLAVATAPVTMVQAAHSEAQAVRARAVHDAEAAAADRVASIRDRAQAQAVEVRAVGRDQAERLRVRAQDCRTADVEAVLAAVLPATRLEGQG